MMHDMKEYQPVATSYASPPWQPAPDEPPPPYSEAVQSMNYTQDLSLQAGDGNVFSASTVIGLRGSPTASNALKLPIVIPQTSKSFKGPFASPFLRAYNRDLERYGISQADFLTFIDALNEAWIGSPGFLPFNGAALVMQQCYGVHPVQLAGIGLAAAAGVGSAVTSFLRVKAYVKAVNETVFHPVGLNVNIRNTQKMMGMIGFPDGQRLTLSPAESDQPDNPSGAIESEIIGAAGTTISPDDPRARRMRALQGYALPLEFSVPGAVSPNTFFEKLCNAQALRLGEKQKKKLDQEREEGEKKFREKSKEADKKSREGQKKVAEFESKIEKERQKLDKALRKDKVQRDPKERLKVIQDFEKEEQKLNHDMAKEQRKVDKDVIKEMKHGEEEKGKVYRKEEKIANKIRWIVITNWDGNDDDDDNVERDEN